MAPVGIDEIYAARERIRDVAVRTPLIPAIGLEVPAGNRLWLKAENFQRTWSFKLRGAYNAAASLDAKERARGVITYSSGNHGQAVACAASLLGIPAVIVMPEDAIPVKVEMTRRYGADVVFAGHTSLDRQEQAMQLAEAHGYAVIPPFDDRRIIAGQGTVGLEIVEQFPEVEAVVVQVGGGGLVSGVATAVKALLPEVRMIGVEPEGAADARDSWRSGTIITWPSVETVADGLRTSRVGELNFATIRELVDDIVTVSDEEILSAVRTLVNGAKLVAEPSGAVATAAVLTGRTGLRDMRIAAVISGGNIDPERLRSCLEPDTLPEQVGVPG
jgi:threonine dehydratase